MNFFAAYRRGFTRWQASGLHLFISATIAAVVLTVMLGVWYPPPIFQAEGGMGLVFILVGVDVVIGPLITLIIFKSGKWGLKFDLFTIATLQIAALLYGVYIVYVARPVYLVLVKGQFELVTAVELTPKWLEEARRPEFRSLPVTGPEWVAFDMPANEDERQVIIQSVIFGGGRDAQHYPKYYLPYAERAKAVLADAQTIEAVRKTSPHTARVIDAWLKQAGKRDADVRHFPMRTRFEWIAVLVDATSGEIVKLLLIPDQA